MKKKDEPQLKRRKRKRWKSSEIQLFIMAMLGIAFVLVFSYAPMFGIVLAFKDADGYLYHEGLDRGTMVRI